MPLIKTYLVDSFTDQAGSGNPAGVCLNSSELSDEIRQKVAIELALSETAFVEHTVEPNTFGIRYFSPKMEIPLCGHATLAAAKVIFAQSEENEILFITGHGVHLRVKESDGMISMQFPIYSTHAKEAPPTLLHALGLTEIIDSCWNEETNILLVQIEDAAVLRNLDPDFNLLINSTDKFNGVLVTAKSQDTEFDFYSRYFWPWSGTFEDPVTGGTHTFLAPYWSERLGKLKMRSYQCSDRGGWMNLEILSPGSLLISAKAVLTFEISLNI